MLTEQIFLLLPMIKVELVAAILSFPWSGQHVMAADRSPSIACCATRDDGHISQSATFLPTCRDDDPYFTLLGVVMKYASVSVAGNNMYYPAPGDCVLSATILQRLIAAIILGRGDVFGVAGVLWLPLSTDHLLLFPNCRWCMALGLLSHC